MTRVVRNVPMNRLSFFEGTVISTAPYSNHRQEGKARAAPHCHGTGTSGAHRGILDGRIAKIRCRAWETGKNVLETMNRLKHRLKGIAKVGFTSKESMRLPMIWARSFVASTEHDRRMSLLHTASCPRCPFSYDSSERVTEVLPPRPPTLGCDSLRTQPHTDPEITRAVLLSLQLCRRKDR
jgi:hypothetical protein